MQYAQSNLDFQILERRCWLFSGSGFHCTALAVGDPLLERLVHSRHCLPSSCRLRHFQQSLKSCWWKPRVDPP